MNFINTHLLNADLPPGTLAWNVALAALAALGLTSVIPASGGRGQAMLVVPVLTVLLAVLLVSRAGALTGHVRQKNGSAATTHPLTGLATPAVGEQVLAMQFAAAQRGQSLALVLIRIERLPRYRVRHGKAVSDQLLRHAGRVLQRHRRGMHLAAHHAGEEATFLSILAGSDREGAATYATRVRRELLRLKGLPDPEGVSVGVAAFDMSMKSPGALLRQAEFALKKGAAAGGKVMVVGEAGATAV